MWKTCEGTDGLIRREKANRRKAGPFEGNSISGKTGKKKVTSFSFKNGQTTTNEQSSHPWLRRDTGVLKETRQLKKARLVMTSSSKREVGMFPKRGNSSSAK